MNILITGDAGFVGRAFHRALDDANTITGVDIVNGIDARDFFRTNNVQYDLVIHLAAVVGGRVMIEGQPLQVAVDLSIDSEMFIWAVRTKQPRIVYFSSSAAYPVWAQTFQVKMRLHESLIDLTNISTPDQSYGWSKLSGEMLAGYARDMGVNVHVLRPFSGYGEDQDLTYPFPSFIHRAINKADPFAVWGDGNQVRDFIHIEDVVNATMKAVELDVQEPVNLGWGRPSTFNDIAEYVTQQMSYTPVIEHIEAAPTGVQYRVSNPHKMLNFYTPKISLEEGISRAIKHWQTI